MKKQSTAVFISANTFFLIIILVSCASVPMGYTKPDYEDSHALLIEKTALMLPVVEMANGSVSTGERVLVASMEKPGHDSYGINCLVEDLIISLLVSEGYTLLERGEVMLHRFYLEQNPVYTEWAMRNFPSDPFYSMLRIFEKEDLRLYSSEEQVDVLKLADRIEQIENVYINRDGKVLDINEVIELYTILRGDYLNLRDKIAANVTLETADVLFSYRVLEAGLSGAIEIKPPDSSRAGLSHVYKREAVIRLFVKITDAKTGVIRRAGIVENRIDDAVEFRQLERESERQYYERLEKYIRMLEEYNFRFYSQTLPNRKKQAIEDVFQLEEDIYILPDTDKEKVSSFVYREEPKLSVGIKGGLNIGWFSGSGWNRALSDFGASNRPRIGFSGTAFFEASLTNWLSVQPEIGFTGRKGGVEYYYFEEKIKETVKVQTVDFSIFAKPSVRVGNGYIYGLAGPRLFLIPGDIAVEAETEDISASMKLEAENRLLAGAAAGGGYKTSVGPGSVSFDILYTHVLSSISDESQILLNSVTVSFGYVLPIN